jgi:hypothetical protein
MKELRALFSSQKKTRLRCPVQGVAPYNVVVILRRTKKERKYTRRDGQAEWNTRHSEQQTDCMRLHSAIPDFHSPLSPASFSVVLSQISITFSSTALVLCICRYEYHTSIQSIAITHVASRFSSSFRHSVIRIYGVLSIFILANHLSASITEYMEKECAYFLPSNTSASIFILSSALSSPASFSTPFSMQPISLY